MTRGKGLLIGLAMSLIVPVAGCDDAPSPLAPTPAAPSAADDLDLLLDQLETIHPEPFHGIPRADWVADLRDLQQRLPGLSDDEAVVAVMRLVAELSSAGRDGHQFALPQPGHEGTVLPVRWYELEGELVVTDGRAPYADLTGAVVDAVDGIPTEEVLALVEPLVPRDGPATVPLFRPMLMVRSQVLSGLGIGDGGAVTLTVSLDGVTREVAVEPVPFATYTGWTGGFGAIRLPELPGAGYRGRLDDVLRSHWIGTTLYVRLTEIQEQPDAAVLRRLESARLRRVVLDLRQNPGGDNHNNGPWVTALDGAVERGAALVLLTDRVTFSAASNLTTDLELALDPVVVGEAMGGGLNFWNDVTQVSLDGLPVPMQVGISTRYWMRSTAEDPRLTLRPDHPVPVTADDVLAGRDPALRVALRLRTRPGA